MPRRYAIVYGVQVGVGGLGAQVGNAIRALALGGHEVHAIGPGFAGDWPDAHGRIIRHDVPPRWLPQGRWSPLRSRAGLVQEISDRRIGSFAKGVLEHVRPDLCYTFTQVGLEPLRWARTRGVAAVLESPNGHIRNYRRVFLEQTARWCGGTYRGHPTLRMVRRVEQEYQLATDIRVSSDWARRSLIADGATETPITVLQQPVDVRRFVPQVRTTGASRVLRVCFVGSLDLRKGFVYLLRAARLVDAALEIELVGATGDRCCRRLLAAEQRIRRVRVGPGDPRPALARADLFVLPTLEDGSPFAVAEAMACGLPVVTTTSTGAAEWVREDETGWLVPAASETALAGALRTAGLALGRLQEMGLQARRDTERRVAGSDEAVAAWVASR